MAYIDLNEKLSVDLNNGQFVERTDILTEYSDKLKIYQSTTHENNGQNFAWIKLAPHCSFDIYFVADSEKYLDYICVFEGYYEKWEHAIGGTYDTHYGGYNNYRYLGNWKKMQISNYSGENKYYTVIWRKVGSVNKYEDIGLFAINITNETIEPSPIIELNDNISLDLGGGQFVERTDILTEYSDKLKIYQSTAHVDNGQSYAWIKLAPHCSYDLYLIANSEVTFDYISIFEGYVDVWEYGSGGYVIRHEGGDVDYTKLYNWNRVQISNDTDEDKYYTVIWAKNSTDSANEDIGLFAINITTETIVSLPEIELNENISVDLNNGQFIERTDIMTGYSDKLKIYQSTAHVDNGQSYAWIKLSPNCSYDLYLIANSQANSDYICIFEGKIETWTGGYITKHGGGNLSYRYLGNWTKTQISNNTDADKYYTVIWRKNGSASYFEDIGLFAINITTETIVPEIDLSLINLNDNISVDLGDGQFVERTDIFTKYSDKLKIYQSTSHRYEARNFAWIKLAPHCSYDFYLVADSEYGNDFIYIFDGYVETLKHGAGGYSVVHYGGDVDYTDLNNWYKRKISNETDEDKYYTVIWAKNSTNSKNEDIGLFAINITTETIVPEIKLNDNISVDLNNGQFVSRLDILTEYSDKLKIYQSTTHDDNGQNFAWIKLAPHCSYDLYLVANSEKTWDYICISEGYVETLMWEYAPDSNLTKHVGGNVDYTNIFNWTKTQISNDTDTDKYYTVIWGKDGGGSSGEDIGMFAINITNEIIVPSNILFQDGKRLFYFGNEFVRHIKYNDVNVNNIGTLVEYTNSYGVWSTIESWWGIHNSLLEQWNIMRPVWFKSNTFSDSTPLSISFNIFYREGLAEDAPITGSKVNAILSVYDADGNRMSKQEKPIPRSNENGITEEENTSLSLGFTVINNVGLYVPNTMVQTQAAFTNFPDLYKVKFDDVTIPTGGYYEIFFTTVNNPYNSWIIWDTNVKVNIL